MFSHSCNGTNIFIRWEMKCTIPSFTSRWIEHFIFYLVKIFVSLHSKTFIICILMSGHATQVEWHRRLFMNFLFLNAWKFCKIMLSYPNICLIYSKSCWFLSWFSFSLENKSCIHHGCDNMYSWKNVKNCAKCALATQKRQQRSVLNLGGPVILN